MSTYVGVDWAGKRWVLAVEADGDLRAETAPSMQAVGAYRSRHLVEARLAG